jgi:hypothetical protein
MTTQTLNQCRRSLVVRTTGDGKLEASDPSSQLSVHFSVGIESVVHTTTLLLVQNNLQNLAAIFLGAGTLADDLDRVDDIGKDGVVDGGQGTRTRTLLLLRGAAAVAALGAGQDAARGQDQDVAVGEFLLEFAGQALLDLVEAGEEGNGDEDDDRALVVADFELWVYFVSRLSFCLSCSRFA